MAEEFFLIGFRKAIEERQFREMIARQWLGTGWARNRRRRRSRENPNNIDQPSAGRRTATGIRYPWRDRNTSRPVFSANETSASRQRKEDEMTRCRIFGYMNLDAGTVAIIGAGVSGLTCAVLFAERGYDAHILAENRVARYFPRPPARCGSRSDAEPLEAVIAWSLETYSILRDLSRTPGCGVSMIELRQFRRICEIEIPPWAISLGANGSRPASIPHCFTSGSRSMCR